MRVGRILITGSLSVATAFAGLAVAPDLAGAATATRYVATTGADGTNTCLVEKQPCKTIQHAVDAAASGDTIDIAKGSYDESVTSTKSLALRGAASDDTTILGNPDRNGAGISFAGDDENQPITASITDLGVRGVLKAPGIAGLNTRLTVTNGYLIDNQIGVLAAGGSLALSDSVVSDNGDSENSGIFGGGGVFAAAPVTVARSTVSGNAGPGLAAVSTSATVQPAVTIQDSSLSNNAFAGVISSGGTLTVGNTTLDGNRVAGVAASNSVVTVTDSTVSGTRSAANPAIPTGSQGGLYYQVPQSNTELAPERLVRGVTASLPRTSAIRKALAPTRAPRAAGPGITVTGSIVDSSDVPDCIGPNITDGGYNLSSDAKNSCGFTAANKSLTRTDPKLGEFAVNGGTTENRVPGAGSKAIDAIPTGSAGCVKGATDQRGIARPQGTRCDIGAVEVVSPLRIVTKSLPHGQVDETYRKTLQATGGADDDYVWSLAKGSSLPDGLTLSKGGVISGTPTKAGTYSVTVSVNDPVTRKYSLVIDAAAAAPNGNGADPVANTGAPSASLIALGSGLLLAGLVVLLAAGLVGRRPGRHRTA